MSYALPGSGFLDIVPDLFMLPRFMLLRLWLVELFIAVGMFRLGLALDFRLLMKKMQVARVGCGLKHG